MAQSAAPVRSSARINQRRVIVRTVLEYLILVRTINGRGEQGGGTLMWTFDVQSTSRNLSEVPLRATNDEANRSAPHVRGDGESVA
jgi:hypothetical protein